MSAFSVENPYDGKTFENYTRFEWGVEVGVVTTFMLRLFVPHEFDMLLTVSLLDTYRECSDFCCVLHLYQAEEMVPFLYTSYENFPSFFL